MTPGRRKRILEAIRHHRERLEALDCRRYRRECDYWRVVTYHVNRIRGLMTLLEDGERCPR